MDVMNAKPGRPEERRTQEQNAVLGLCLFLIRAYQAFLSPFLGGCCRFEPSCSEYSCQAILKHGVIRGIELTARRLWRCRPAFSGGDDPVPDRDYFSLPVLGESEGTDE